MIVDQIPDTDSEYQEFSAVLQNKQELSPQKQQQLQLEEYQQQRRQKHEASNNVVKRQWNITTLSPSLR